jgi:hypothetical protein
VDAGCACQPGEVCEDGICSPDCGHPAAEPCGVGTTCDFATGACVADGTAGILTGPDEVCAEGGATCRPGTACTVEDSCEPAPPCRAMNCQGDVCWGADCDTSRPAPGCTPPTLERLNQADFLTGNGRRRHRSGLRRSLQRLHRHAGQRNGLRS